MKTSKTQLLLTLMLVTFLSTSLLSISQETNGPRSTKEEGASISANRAVGMLCPPNSVFGQAGDTPTMGYFSDNGTLNNSQKMYDQFSGLVDDIEGIKFWGILWSGGECYTGGPVDFEISFYNDNTGAIGSLNQTFSATLTPIVTSSLVSGSSLLEFEFDLPSPVLLNSGWVSVVRKNPGNLPCVFAWANTTSGDDAYGWNELDGTYAYFTGDNLAFCLTGGPPPVPISNRAIILGILLIGISLIVRYRKKQLV